MTAVQDRLRSYGPGAFVAAGLIVLGFFYPQYFESLGDLPLIGDFIPGVGSMVIMIAFTAGVSLPGPKEYITSDGPGYRPRITHQSVPTGA